MASAKVGTIMGSESDLPVAEGAWNALDELGVGDDALRARLSRFKKEFEKQAVQMPSRVEAASASDES